MDLKDFQKMAIKIDPPKKTQADNAVEEIEKYILAVKSQLTDNQDLAVLVPLKNGETVQVLSFASEDANMIFINGFNDLEPVFLLVHLYDFQIMIKIIENPQEEDKHIGFEFSNKTIENS